MARSSQGFSANRHTFLTPAQLQVAGERLDFHPVRKDFSSGSENPVVNEVSVKSPLKVSEFLSHEVLQVFRKHPYWQKAQPILLGSWGRAELAPKSDLDLLFLGPEEVVLQLTSDLQKQAFRIRYRVPENIEDWSQGVESADLLALWQAQGETPEAAEKLEIQQARIFGNRKMKHKILKDILEERKKRAQRFDSIHSFLEPHLKYGAGGLRDLFQGQVMLNLFKESFQNFSAENVIFQKDKLFLMTLRHKMHLNGDSDVLIATEQFELADWLKVSQSDLMKEVQQTLMRVHFYSEWVLEMARLGFSSEKNKEKKKKQKPLKLQKPEDLFLALQKDPSILTQYQVRKKLESQPQKKISIKSRGLILKKLFSEKTTDPTLQAVFQSRLIDFLCPRITHLIGHVQHDQYHRFTADAHLLQSCREVLRHRQKKDGTSGPMKKWQKLLSKTDWAILAWTALYHDLAKGLKGDHSQIGEQWVKEDLKAFGFPKSFIVEVQWLVRHHLELSIAAFKKNPQAPETWQELQDLGLNSKRLLRLGLWTMFDIKATNPDAWNEWKAKLLANLMERVSAGGTQNFLKLKKELPLVGVSPEWIDHLDPSLFEAFSARKLKEDLQKSLKMPSSWNFLKDQNKKLWLRYYQSEDRPGLLSEVVERITSSGASIQHALVQTLPGFGVYDWFQVQTHKEPAQLIKWIEQMKVSEKAVPPVVVFLNIKIISQNPNEWVLSFKGLDQKGLLLAAAKKLKDLGVQIKSARVHTWGRQIEDLFSITPPAQDSGDFLSHLKEGLIQA